MPVSTTPASSPPLSPAPHKAVAGLSADGPADAPGALAVDAATLAAVVAALKEQGATLQRVQATLELLLRGLGPSAAPGDGDSASAVADPMGAGFTLSQRALAEALAIPASYVSTLVRAFKLDEDPLYALTVRPGVKRLVNYHPRAVDRFRELVRCPPDSLDRRAHRTLDRVRSRLREPAQAA